MSAIRRRYIVVIAAVAVAGLVFTAWLVLRTTYEDTLNKCADAIAAHDFDRKPVKPGGQLEGCEGVKRDDYGTLVLNNAAKKEGWLDEEGNVDRNEMLKDALEEQP